MNKISPTFSMDNGLDPTRLSHNKEIVQAYINDPLVHDRISARLGLMMLSQGDWILEHAPKNQIPTLVMIGSQEGIVSKAAVDEYCRIAPNVTYKVWPDLFHEIHNEAENKEVFAFTKKWIDERLQ
jgi:alpha-beta hydrolase superfamily lysophospholipase